MHAPHLGHPCFALSTDTPTHHKWGPSPFHYDLAYYQEMSKRVEQSLSGR